MKRDDTVKIKTPVGEKNVDLKALENMPMSEYLGKAKKFTNTDAHIYSDSAVYAAGSAILLGKTVSLFTKGKGEQDKIQNTGAAYEKKELHTNMIEGGEFDNSTTFILEMIGVDVTLSADAHAQVNGEIQAPAVAAVATYSAVNHWLALRKQFKLTFYIGEQELYSGKLYEFPNPLVMSGAFGASLGGFIQNGFSLPNWNKITSPQVLKSNDRFRVELEPLADTFTPQQAFTIDVMLFGKRIRRYR